MLKNMTIFAKGFAILLMFITHIATAAPGESSAKILVKLSPAGSFSAITPEITGNVTLQKDGSIEAKNIKVQLKNLKSGMSLRDEHMTKKYLEVEKYPEAVLVSAKGKNGKGEGLIKIKGIEKKVTGTYVLSKASLSAKFQISLSDFNIKGIRYMGVGVKDSILVEVVVPVK